MNSKAFVAVALSVLTFSAMAAKPAAPTMAIMQSNATCDAYVNKVSNWLMGHNLIVAGMTYSGLAGSRALGGSLKVRTNNGQWTYYIGVSKIHGSYQGMLSACHVATLGSAQAQKHIFNNYIEPGYTQGVIDKKQNLSFAGSSLGFGLYGPATTCSPGHYSGCRLFEGKYTPPN